jgi:hypothetical protein
MVCVSVVPGLIGGPGRRAPGQNRQVGCFIHDAVGSPAAPVLRARVSNVAGDCDGCVSAAEIGNGFDVYTFHEYFRSDEDLNGAEDTSVVRPVTGAPARPSLPRLWPGPRRWRALPQSLPQRLSEIVVVMAWVNVLTGFVAGCVSASQAGGTILHPCKPLLGRPVLVEADIVRIQVGKDLPAQL